jgi:hypothetical protein
MATLAPPPVAPGLRPGDDDRLKAYRMRMTQTAATLVTLLATVWLCTLGAIPAIIAVCTAKHVLVAILMMGLGVDRPETAEA